MLFLILRILSNILKVMTLVKEDIIIIIILKGIELVVLGNVIRASIKVNNREFPKFKIIIKIKESTVHMSLLRHKN
jgi:hypothetical protein